jgi:hypothetical protein
MQIGFKQLLSGTFSQTIFVTSRSRMEAISVNREILDRGDWFRTEVCRRKVALYNYSTFSMVG